MLMHSCGGAHPSCPRLGHAGRSTISARSSLLTQGVWALHGLCGTLPQKTKGKETETTSNKRRKRKTKMYSYMSSQVINMWLVISLYIFLHLKTYFQKHTEPRPSCFPHTKICLSHGGGYGVQIVLKFVGPPLLHKLSVHVSGFSWRTGSYSYVTFRGGGLLHNICPIDLALWGCTVI